MSNHVNAVSTVMLSPVWETVGIVLRYLGWLVFTGLVAAGACWGGYGIYVTWLKDGPYAHRRRRSAEAALIMESARGIAEIEAFLIAQSAPRPREQPPGSGGETA